MIAAVVTRGFGSFSTAALVVTAGYISGSTPEPTPTVPSRFVIRGSEGWGAVTGGSSFDAVTGSEGWTTITGRGD